MAEYYAPEVKEHRWHWPQDILRFCWRSNASIWWATSSWTHTDRQALRSSRGV